MKKLVLVLASGLCFAGCNWKPGIAPPGNSCPCSKPACPCPKAVVGVPFMESVTAIPADRDPNVQWWVLTDHSGQTWYNSNKVYLYQWVVAINHSLWLKKDCNNKCGDCKVIIGR